MQRRFRQVLTSLREHTFVSYAKMATAGGFCDLDLIVVKATSPDDLPLPDRYVHELLKIFSISPSSYRDFAISFTRRFGKTQCWRVALKCLVLLHRLLRSLPDNTVFKNELLWARSNGFLSLYPCHFRDCSSSAHEHYTLFIRSYAQLLDEALDCLSIGKEIEVLIDEEMPAEEEEDDDQALPDKMKEIDTMLQLLPQVQSLIDRVMDCRPNGAAAKNFVVQSAMKYIIRDSFICYTTFRREIVVVLEHLIQMPYTSCIAAFGIYKKAALQAKQLSEFYDWCKSLWLCGIYEYPFIDQIPQIQIQALETFLNGMWQLTDQSSSSTEYNSITSTLESPSSSNEDNRDKQVIRPEYFGSNNCATEKENGTMDKSKKDGEDMEPLIQFDDDDDENVSWEALLEASINSSCMISKNFSPNGHGDHGNGYGYGNNYSADVSRDEANGWQMQVYNPYSVNPFCQSHNMAAANYYGSNSSNSAYPWGL